MNNINDFVPVEFQCNAKIGKRLERWDGSVTNMVNHGSHYEIYINSRSGFVIIVGRCVSGGFISIPEFKVGSDLSDFGDYFWNNECLSKLMNPVDAATVAETLRSLKTHNYI